MAPVGFRAATGVGASNPTSIPKPAGTGEGDYVLISQVDDNDSTLAQMGTPTGGTTFLELFSSDVVNPRVKIWGKIAGASEPANYGISGAGTADRSASCISIPAGTFDPAQPIFSGPTATTGATNTNAHTAPSINSVIDGLLITLHHGGRNTNAARSYTPPTGMTERVDTNAGGYSGWVCHEANTLALTAGGTTGTRTATPSATTQHCSVALVIKPASAVSPPVADAGADAAINTGSEFARTGTGTNNPTSYSWSLTSAPAGVTTGVVATVAALSYTPTVAGTYIFTLSATNAGGTGTDTVTLTVTDPAGGTTSPSIRQHQALTSASLTSSIQTGTLGSAAVAGNLLVVCGAGDKNVGGFTVSDNIGTNGGANPWTEEMDVAGASVSSVHAWKVAVGGETTITLTSASANGTGAESRVIELQQDGSGAWQVVAVTPVAAYSDTNVATRSTGATGAATYPGLAIAMVTVDSIAASSNLFPVTWTNGFTDLVTPSIVSGSGGGNAAVFTATKQLAAGDTAETTVDFNGSLTEQAYGFMAAYGRQQSSTVIDTTKFFLAA